MADIICFKYRTVLDGEIYLVLLSMCNSLFTKVCHVDWSVANELVKSVEHRESMPQASSTLLVLLHFPISLPF